MASMRGPYSTRHCRSAARPVPWRLFFVAIWLGILVFGTENLIHSRPKVSELKGLPHSRMYANERYDLSEPQRKAQY